MVRIFRSDLIVLLVFCVYSLSVCLGVRLSLLWLFFWHGFFGLGSGEELRRIVPEYRPEGALGGT